MTQAVTWTVVVTSYFYAVIHFSFLTYDAWRSEMSTYNRDCSLKSERHRLCTATDQGTRYAGFSPAHFGVETTLSTFNISVCTLIRLYFATLTDFYIPSENKFKIRLLVSSCPSVWWCTWNRATTTYWVFVNIHVLNIYENLLNPTFIKFRQS